MDQKDFNAKDIQPPVWTNRFLKWYCAPNLLEEVEGDIYEMFYRRCDEQSSKKAKRMFVWDVLRFCNYSTIKGNRKFFEANNPNAMFKNYLKVSLRNLLNEKLYTVVNLTGLSIGLACAILIGLFVKDEWSFDKFHSKSDDIYRVWVKEDHGNNEIYFNSFTPPVLGTTLKNALPEAAQVVRINVLNTLVKKGDFNDAEPVLIAEDGFFEMFDFNVKEGKAGDLLSKPNYVVLSESMAKKYFGDADPSGELITIEFGGEEKPFTVSGIVADAPINSSIKYQLIVSYENFEQYSTPRQKESWYHVSIETYVLTHQGTSPEDITSKMEAIIKEQLGDRYPKNGYVVGLQPLADIHLNSDIPVGIAPVSDWKYSYILGTIAMFILLVAAINFMTLSIGRSLNRAKEVGVRKSIGATRKQIITQYWSEAVLTAFFAMIVGIVLVSLSLPTFNSFTSKSLSLSFSIENILLILSITLITGLLSGIYPALVLSGFSPVSVLKGASGNVFNRKNNDLFRKLMVGLQFVLSVILVSGSLIMREQLQFLQNKSLGYNQEQLIVIPQNANSYGFREIITNGMESGKLLKKELEKISDVKIATTSVHSFNQNGWLALGYENAEGIIREFNLNVVDENYLQVHDIEVLDGRNFSEEILSDSKGAIVINEKLAETFGWQVGMHPDQFPDYEVIGVVKDFHFTSLHSPIKSAMMVMNPIGILDNINNIEGTTSITPKVTVKLQTENFSAALDKLETAYHSVYPNLTFDFVFVDEALRQMYEREQQMGNILNYATALGLLIACLGLFGLITLVVNKRAKEIGIRKVLGAPVYSILVQISKEFVWIVLSAILIATPLTWYIMDQWLMDFSFRIDINPLVFVVAGVIMLVVTFITISYHAYKAAKLDPVKTLKME